MESEPVVTEAPDVSEVPDAPQGQPDGGGTAPQDAPEEIKTITADEFDRLEREAELGDAVPDGEDEGFKEGEGNEDEPGEPGKDGEGEGEGEEADPLDKILSKLSDEEKEHIEALRRSAEETSRRQIEMETQQAEQAFRQGEVFALLPQDFVTVSKEKFAPLVERKVDEYFANLQERLGAAVGPLLTKLQGGFDPKTGEELEPATEQEVFAALRDTMQIVLGVKNGDPGIAGVLKDFCTRSFADGAMEYRKHAGDHSHAAIDAEISQAESAMVAEVQRLGWSENDARIDAVAQEVGRLVKGGKPVLHALKEAFEVVQKRVAPAAEAAAAEARKKEQKKKMLSMGGTANRSPDRGLSVTEVKRLANGSQEDREQLQKLISSGAIRVTG